MTRLSWFLLPLALGLTQGCKSPTKESPQPTATAARAASSVKPGSHDDWCEEHQVPESLCTRCNASLVPAFKAAGDWCNEHSVPESQCSKCNPNLKITRPPKSGG